MPWKLPTRTSRGSLETARRVLIPVLVSLLACGDDPADLLDPVVDRVEIDAESLLLPGVGLERTLAGKAFGPGGTELTEVAFRWGVREPTLATVSSNGTVTARRTGATELVLSAGDATTSIPLDILQIPESITLTPETDTLTAIGARTVIRPAAIDSAGNEIVAPDGAWSSSDFGIVDTNSGASLIGVGRAVAPGTATISWTFRGVTETTELVVAQRPTSAWLRGGRSPIQIGDTTQVTGTLRDDRQNDIAGEALTWSTSDSTIATVSSSGLVTAQGAGNVVIRGVSGPFSDEHSLTVALDVPVNGPLNLGPAPLVADALWQTFVLESTVDFGGGTQAVPAAWTSRDWDVAGVEGALATARGPGATWLVAEHDGFTDSLRIEVTQVPVGVTFQGLPAAFSITFSDGASLHPLAVDRGGSAIASSYTSASVVSRDTTIITVGSAIRGVRAGRAWVVADVLGFLDSLDVTVLPVLGGGLEISTIQDLAVVEDLGVEEVRGSLTVDATALSSLSGLESIRTVSGDVSIVHNPSLTDVSGLANLETVGGRLVIDDNSQLADPSLPRLIHAGSLILRNNPTLSTTTPFPLVERIPGILDIIQPAPELAFPALVETGLFRVFRLGPARIRLPALRFVEGVFDIIDAEAVVSVEAPRLWHVHSVVVRGNEELTELGLGALSTIERDLKIENNPRLVSLANLPITSSVRDLTIRLNDSLSDVDGLRSLGDALASDPIVSRDLWIEDNPALSASTVNEILILLDEKYFGNAVGESRVVGRNGG